MKTITIGLLLALMGTVTGCATIADSSQNPIEPDKKKSCGRAMTQRARDAISPITGLMHTSGHQRHRISALLLFIIGVFGCYFGAKYPASGWKTQMITCSTAIPAPNLTLPTAF